MRRQPGTCKAGPQNIWQKQFCPPHPAPARCIRRRFRSPIKCLPSELHCWLPASWPPGQAALGPVWPTGVKAKHVAVGAFKARMCLGKKPREMWPHLLHHWKSRWRDGVFGAEEELICCGGPWLSPHGVPQHLPKVRGLGSRAGFCRRLTEVTCCTQLDAASPFLDSLVSNMGWLSLTSVLWGSLH